MSGGKTLFFVSLELDSRISSLSSTGRSVPCNSTDPQKLSRNGATGKPFSKLLAAQSNLKVIHAEIYVLPTHSNESEGVVLFLLQTRCMFCPLTLSSTV